MRRKTRPPSPPPSGGRANLSIAFPLRPLRGPHHPGVVWVIDLSSPKVRGVGVSSGVRTFRRWTKCGGFVRARPGFTPLRPDLGDSFPQTVSVWGKEMPLAPGSKVRFCVNVSSASFPRSDQVQRKGRHSSQRCRQAPPESWVQDAGGV